MLSDRNGPALGHRALVVAKDEAGAEYVRGTAPTAAEAYPIVARYPGAIVATYVGTLDDGYGDDVFLTPDGRYLKNANPF